MPGVIAGFMLVFVPAIGEFVIPELLGGPDTLMIGRVLWNEFFANRDWPVASAVAIAMLVALLVPIVILRGAQAREDYPERDDANWMKHTLCWVDARGAVRFDYRPVTLTTLTNDVQPIPPKARTY